MWQFDCAIASQQRLDAKNTLDQVKTQCYSGRSNVISKRPAYPDHNLNNNMIFCPLLFMLVPFRRCKVPECDVGDNNRVISYDQPWLSYAIPTTSNGYENCLRFAPIATTTDGQQCSADRFNTSKQIACTEFVYTTDETNVQTEVRFLKLDSFYSCLLFSLVRERNVHNFGGWFIFVFEQSSRFMWWS